MTIIVAETGLLCFSLRPTTCRDCTDADKHRFSWNNEKGKNGSMLPLVGQSHSFIPAAPGRLSIQYLLAPIGIADKSCVCVSVYCGDFGRVNKGRGEEKVWLTASLLIHRDFLPQLQINPESMRLFLPALCSSNKEKQCAVFSSASSSTELPRRE